MPPNNFKVLVGDGHVFVELLHVFSLIFPRSSEDACHELGQGTVNFRYIAYSFNQECVDPVVLQQELVELINNSFDDLLPADSLVERFAFLLRLTSHFPVLITQSSLAWQ